MCVCVCECVCLRERERERRSRRNEQAGYWLSARVARRIAVSWEYDKIDVG